MLKKHWNTSWDNEGQFLSGIGEGLYGIGKFFLWDASILGTSVKAADSIGCLANYSACEKQQEAAAAPWQKDFWGTAEKTFIQPTLDDWANHPAHALGKLVPDLAMFAIPGGGLIKGARVAEEAGAATETGATAVSEGAQALKGPIADAIPQNLPQQLALGAAKDGQGTIIMRDLGDSPRLEANYGPGEWVKMQYVLRGTDSNVTVHYFRNLTTNTDVEFKFK